MTNVKTRDSLDSAKTGIIRLLVLIRGLTDEEIDDLMDADEVAGLDKAIWDLVDYAEDGE